MSGLDRTGRRWKTWVRVALAAVAAAVTLHAGARFVASRPAVEAALREKLLTALRARLGDVSIGGPVALDWALRPTFGPLTVAGQRGAAPVLAVERVRVRPALLALLRGRLSPAAIDLGGARLSPGPDGDELRALVRRASGGAAPGGGPAAARNGLPDLRVRDLVIALGAGQREVIVGPFDVDLSASGPREGLRLAVDVRIAGGGTADLAARRTKDGWSFDLHARGVSPAPLPARARSGAVRIDGGDLSFDLRGEAASDLSRVSVAIDGSARRLVFSGDRLGGSMGPLDARASGVIAWDGASRRASLADGKVTLQGALPVTATAEVRLVRDQPFSASLAALAVDYRALAAALPPALAPPAEAPRPGGTFDARLDVEGPLGEPEAWKVAASLDLARMREAAAREPPVALRRTFEHRPPEPDGKTPAIVVGPENPAFVPIGELPDHVVRAVTTAEDGGFFGHQGFDFDEIRNALEEGAEAGRVVRGGSTITQQLAKNLYLSQEKTVARKVREALATVALEASVPKRRLLEIYLNVAEWAPGLWGIGPAARHWFGKSARDLTPKEAAFLASIIPNPVRYHYMFARGAPTDDWEQRVHELLLKMDSQGAISDDDLTRALGEPIVFRGG